MSAETVAIVEFTGRGELAKRTLPQSATFAAGKGREKKKSANRCCVGVVCGVAVCVNPTTILAISSGWAGGALAWARQVAADPKVPNIHKKFFTLLYEPRA